MGPSIELAGWNYGSPDINKVQLADLTGLRVVPFAICPHFQEADKTKIEPYIKTVSYPIYVLTDTQGVLVEHNRYEVVGEGEELIYNK
jgi:hypothetical protein